MKQRSYRFTQLADSDVDQIWDSIADDNLDVLRIALFQRYISTSDYLRSFPALGIADRTWLVIDPYFSFP